MKKTVFAVFDSSKDYIEKFLDYIKRKKNTSFEILGFSDRKALSNYVKTNTIDVLLFSQEEEVDDEKNGEESCEIFISHENIKKFVYLGKQRKSKTTVRHIYKYQSMEKIIYELTELTDREESKEEKHFCKLIGVYCLSPNSETFQVSLNIAAKLSMNSSILFLCFDRFSILDSEQTGKSSISDLIYYFKNNPKKIKEELNKTVGHYKGFDFLTAPTELSDIDELSFSQWKDFFSTIAKEGNYEWLIIDMYEVFKNLEEIFASCEKVYIPIVKNDYELRKVKMLKEYLNGRERKDLLEKLTVMTPEG